MFSKGNYLKIRIHDFNHYYPSKLCAGIGGFLFGYDTGVISGAMSVILEESRKSEGGSCVHPMW
jgi:hypothetical protein